MKNFEYIKPSTVTLASELLKGEHTDIKFFGQL